MNNTPGRRYEALAAGLFVGEYLCPLYVIWRRRDPDQITAWVDVMGALALVALVFGFIFRYTRPRLEQRAIGIGIGLSGLTLAFPFLWRLLRFMVGW